ncbi:MAG: chorismate synthase [Lachnospiraceae bacterium]|nr:chorismate synthase [Lachnospiraceae bacterium]
MAGSIFGEYFRITTWGESHGPGIGVVIDGCPAGIPITAEEIQESLNRRKPGQSKYTTPRKENDLVEIMSGVFEGKTTGTPISLMVRNETQRSSDYSEIASYYRPSHADYTFDEKFGFRDYRGGGRSSGRETIGRVAAGAIAKKLLEGMGIKICAYTKSIGPVCMETFDEAEIENNPFRIPDANAAARIQEYVDGLLRETDSSGGVIECFATGVPAGLGSPVFDKLDACLAKAIMSIGAVKGVEIGDGFAVAASTGSKNNDNFCMKDGAVCKKTNHAGGILGGISDGDTIVLRAAFKPTPSIFKTQETVNKNGEDISVNIRGRHDPLIMPRAVVVVEAMTALTLVDALLANMSSRYDKILEFYNR